jgi:hypothetical protein
MFGPDSYPEVGFPLAVTKVFLHEIGRVREREWERDGVRELESGTDGTRRVYVCARVFVCF